eukprot:scaffold437_cov444-Pavlova_lutheri.AAC.1
MHFVLPWEFSTLRERPTIHSLKEVPKDNIEPFSLQYALCAMTKEIGMIFYKQQLTATMTAYMPFLASPPLSYYMDADPDYLGTCSCRPWAMSPLSQTLSLH